MTNLTLGVTLLLFAAMGFPAALMALKRQKMRESITWYIMLCVSNTLWAATNALMYLLADEQAAIFFNNIRLAFVSLTSVCLYLVTMTTLERAKLDGRITLYLLVVPTLTLLIAATNGIHGLLSPQVGFTYFKGVRILTAVNGIWFWVHTVYSYALGFLAMRRTIRQISRLPDKYSLPSRLVLGSIIISFSLAAVAVFNVLPYDIDLTPYASVVSQIMLFFALFSPRSIETLVSSRDAIFERTMHPLLVLDTENGIVDSNPFADSVGWALHMQSLKGVPFDVFLEAWIQKYHGQRLAEDESIFTLHQGNSDVHYQICRSELRNRKQTPIGYYMELKNITPIMTLIHTLQESAYFDSLTGLHNRNYFQRILTEWDQEENLPLGILMGDANDLKQTNDTKGHAMGDKLLQTLALILQAAAPPGSLVARVGGDEFAMLVHNSSLEQLGAIQKTVEQQCAQMSSRELPVSIALGYGLHEDAQKPLDETLHQVDLRMYSDKRDRRKNAARVSAPPELPKNPYGLFG